MKKNININIPSSISSGHVTSGFKGIIDGLIEHLESTKNATDFDYTPNGHEATRRDFKEIGASIGAEIYSELKAIEKKS